jgi:hypothetical protein
MFQINIQGVLGLTAVLMCFALALVLYRVSLPGSVARKLSLLLVFEGITLGSSDIILYFMSSPETFYSDYPMVELISGVLHFTGDCTMIVMYPIFLASALQTKITKLFAKKKVQVGLIAYSVLLFIVMILTFMMGIIPLKIGIPMLYLSMATVFAFALIASVKEWRIAQGAAKARALIFVLAFGFRDICWGYIYIVGTLDIWSSDNVHTGGEWDYFVYVLGTLVAVPLIAYGILRTQLFDIDLKIRWTIKQSTLAGFFVAVMYLVSEGASTFLEAELGNVAGLLAAAVLMFFLAPLQRLSERVAAAAMPNTENTPEYASFRKMQVYESALSEAMAEGGISPKERSLLNHLRDSLAISASDAESIEADLNQTNVSFA